MFTCLTSTQLEKTKSEPGRIFEDHLKSVSDSDPLTVCSGRWSSAEVGEFADRWAKLSTNRNRLDVLTNHSRLGYWGEGLYSDIMQI